MAAKIRVRDNGASRVVTRAGLANLKLKVGILGEKAAQQVKGSDVAMTIAQLAEIHELGLGVPERSFLRAWVEANEKQIEADMRAATRQVLLGRLTPEKAAKILGVKFVAGIQAFISSGKVQPPLAQSTIDRKGSSVPLIDTGQLRSAITYAVEQFFS